MARISKSAREAAIAALLDPKGAFALRPGDTVYCVLRHVSKSGMSRRISFFVVKDDGPRYLDYQMSQLDIGPRPDGKDGIVIGGCGMDMGFHAVYTLGRYLWPDGFAPSEVGIRPLDGKAVNVNIGRGRNAGPPTLPEIAELVGKGWKFPGGRNADDSGWDNDGGYALKHRWV